MRNRRQLIRGAVALAGLAGATLAFGAWRGRSLPAAAGPGAPALPLDLPEMSWRMTDHLGAPVTPQDWAGRPVMVFFGFTFCPDICPTTLSDISDWLEAIGPEADRLKIALVSVDPERDTPAALAEYLSNFDPRIIGLTGSPVDLALTAGEFRIRYEKIPAEGGGYTMNHTAGVFLFRADGRFASIIDFHEEIAVAVPKVRLILGS